MNGDHQQDEPTGSGGRQQPSHPGDHGPDERMSPREAIERGRDLLSGVGGEQLSGTEAPGAEPQSAEDIGITGSADTEDWDEWVFESLQKLDRLNRRLEEAGMDYRLEASEIEVSPGSVELEITAVRT